ncbi:MAG: hypothetical protein IPO92_17900 [Saprospiraceae bacterium]|nr:hypothetical protein [Saprospiraceae bacterium]
MGETAVLDGGNTGITFKWYKDGQEISGQTQQTLTVISSGMYEVEVTHISGCKKKDKLIMTFNAKPSILLPPTAQFCEGETYVLQPTNNRKPVY